MEYGIHIEIGDFSFVNVNCVFLDSNRITLGNYVLLGPGVQLLTPGHPVHAAERHIPCPADPGLPMRAICEARPITIADHCWIGAGTIVLPGVTIGTGTTIGAGSVVTKSIPANRLAAGNPCRVIRELHPPADASAEERAD